MVQVLQLAQKIAKKLFGNAAKTKLAEKTAKKLAQQKLVNIV